VANAFPDIPSAELCAVVRAIRVHPRRDKDLRVAVAVFGVFLAIFLHSATPGAWNPSSAQSRAPEEIQMLSPRQIAVVSSLALSSAAVAQNAVQWRVEDGGNGHWYAVIPSGFSFDDAAAAATQLGAHLVTIQSAEEQSFVATQIASGTPFLNAWMGLRQDPKSTEPAGGWRWVTGEPLSGYTNWWLGVPQPDNNACSAGVSENFAMWAKQWGGAWADVTADAVPAAPCSGPQTHALLEWSADCNADGIVDYGQIRSGELADANANNIPDCCEEGFDCRFNAQQWRVESGGNDHWYCAHRFGTLPGSRLLQEAAASQLGASVAAIESESENTHVFRLLQSMGSGEAFGVWIGLYRAAPGLSWQWTSGSSLGWNAWGGSTCAFGPYPNDLNWAGELGTMIYRQNCGLIWDDTPLAWISNPPRWWVSTSNMRLMLEFSADCNADGIVDYGQIRAGELADANANNIPDCCESPIGCCAGDVDGSGAVNGVDLAAILNNWGTNGGKYPGADANGDGTVDATDLALVLGGWGPCN